MTTSNSRSAGGERLEGEVLQQARKPNEIDLVKAVLSAHQTAFAQAHNGEGRGVIESENIAIGYASVELAKILGGAANPVYWQGYNDALDEWGLREAAAQPARGSEKLRGLIAEMRQPTGFVWTTKISNEWADKLEALLAAPTPAGEAPPTKED